MARLMSAATGNFTDAATWGVIDLTSLQEAESGPTNSTTAYVYSQNFTPGAITVDGVAVKVGNRVASPTGTMSIQLFNSTGAVSVAEVTINVSDINNVFGTGVYIRGLYYFKFAAPVLLLAATNYQIGFKTSVNAEVALYRDGTAGNWSRFLRTTTTAAPAAGDFLYFNGEHTGAGTGNDITVTMNNTTTDTFGVTGNRMYISSRGILQFGTTAATNYYFKYRGPFTVYGGGTFRCGSSGTPMPADSTAVIEMDATVNINTGLEISHGGTIEVHGAIKTVNTLLTASNGGWCSTNGTAVTALVGSQDFTGLTGTIRINAVNYTISAIIDSTHLTLTASAGVQTNVVWTHAGTATVVTVADTTGWLAGDELIIAGSTITDTDCERRTILTVDSATQVTLTAALTSMHYGTSPAQSEVGNLTQNVKFRGISAVLSGYTDFSEASSANIKYAQFTRMGGAASRGFSISTNALGTCDVQHCTRYDSTVSGSRGINIASTSGSTITVADCVVFNLPSDLFRNVATTGNYTIDSNLFILPASSGSPIATITDHGVTITDNMFVGCASVPVVFDTDTGVIGTFSGNTAHCFSGSSGGFWWQVTFAGPSTISNTKVWGGSPAANGAVRFNTFQPGPLTIDGLTCFYITTVHLRFSAGIGNLLINNFTSNEAITSGASTGLMFTGPGLINLVRITNSSFSAVSGLMAQNLKDIDFNTTGTFGQVIAGNTIFNGVTEIANIANASALSFVSSQRNDQTAGNHQTWFPEGITRYDSTIFDVAPSSERMTPNNATTRVKSSRFFAAVENGDTCTPSIKVRESVIGDGTDYNGQRARLFVEKNVAAGILADTLLATATVASEGAWETLSGATIAVTDDCVLSFYVDCGGSGYSTGWVNLDTGSVADPKGSSGFTYWKDGAGVVDLGASEAGGGGASAYTYA